MNYNFLLCGKTGLLGQSLFPLLPPTTLCPSRSELDLLKVSNIELYLQHHQPHIIINAAAYTQVDLAESQKDLADRVNHKAVSVMANYARQTGALLVHFSTDYVFDGAKSLPYTEHDRPNPLNAYGHSKLNGEQAIQLSGCNHLIFRLGWLYGPHGHHFVRTILQQAKKLNELHVVGDQIGTPTPVEWLSPIIYRAIQAHLQHRLTSGIYHLSPAGQCSWYEFAQALLPLSYPLHCTNQQHHPRPAWRPRYSVLDNHTLLSTLYFDRPDWNQLLKYHLSSYSYDS